MSDLTEREIERAWREYERLRDGDRIPAEAWRRVRQFKREIAPAAAVIQSALDDVTTVKKLVADFVCRRGVRRQRARAKLREKFAGATFIEVGYVFEIRFLSPRDDALIRDPRDPGEAQPCTVALFAVAGPSNLKRSSCMLCSISIEISDHCLGRFFQRSPDLDPRAVITAAGVAFMQSDANVVLAHINREETFYLGTTRDGMFLCNGIRGLSGTQRIVYARARTWISAEMAGPDQVPLAAADDQTETVGDLVLALAREGSI